MPRKKSNSTINTLSDVPTPTDSARDIVALVKDGGRVTGYKLSDGNIIGKEEGINLAKQGGLRGVGVANRNGNEYLKSLPDANQDNNLSNLPSITQ